MINLNKQLFHIVITSISILVLNSFCSQSNTPDSSIEKPAEKPIGELVASSAIEAQAFIDKAMPNDVIVIKDGTYNNFQLTISRNGNATQPITIKAKNGGSVILTGQSGFLINGDYIKVDGFKFQNVQKMSSSSRNVVFFDNASNSELSNCAFDRCGYDKWAHIVALGNGSTKNVVAHNYFKDIIGQGVGVRGEGTLINSNNHIHHNHFNGTINDNEGNGQEPIQLGQGQDDRQPMYAIVEYNLIENMHGDADPECISNKTSYNTIRYNTIINNSNGKNLVIRGGSFCTVEYNYLDVAGIRVYGDNHKISNNYIKDADYGIRLPGGNGKSYANTNNCVLENNTLINTKSYAIIIGEGDDLLSDITVKNNKIQTNNGTMYHLNTNNKGGMIWEGNIGSGSGTLKTSNIISGVSQGSPETSTSLKALTAAEVGPNW